MVEQLRREMHHGAVAAMADGDAGGRRPGEPDHVGDGVTREGERRRQDERRLREAADRRQILERVVRQLFVEADIDRKCAGGADREDVAVGRRLGDRIEPDRTAGAGPVLDHDGLAEARLQLRLEGARHDLGGAARREGDDQPDRARRIGLRGDAAHEAHKGREAQHRGRRRGCLHHRRQGVSLRPAAAHLL